MHQASPTPETDPATPAAMPSDAYLAFHFGQWHVSTATDPLPEGEDLASDETMKRLKGALESAATTWRNVAGRHDRVMSDPFKTEPSKLRESAKYADEQAARAAATIDGAMGAATRDLEALQSKVAGVLAPSEQASDLYLDQEIRAHLRTLSPLARLELLRNAARNQDAATVRAAINAPAFLTGLDSETADSLRMEYARATMPHVLRRMERLSAGREKVIRASAALVRHVDGLIDRKKLASLERLASD